MHTLFCYTMQTLFCYTMQTLFCYTMQTLFCNTMHAFSCNTLDTLFCHPGLDPGSISKPPWILGASPRMTTPQAQMKPSKETPCPIL